MRVAGAIAVMLLAGVGRTLLPAMGISKLSPLAEIAADEIVAFVAFQSMGLGTAWGGERLIGVVPKPGVSHGNSAYGKGRTFELLPGAARQLAHSLRESLDALPTTAFGRHADEVDGRPAHEIYLLLRGKPVAALEEVSSKLVPALEAALLPHIRDVYSCSNCVACTAFARRYQPGERLLNPNHFDMEAFVTMVVALSNRTEHSGGIYVQAEPRASSRKLVLMDAGDALMHQYDLNHGVAVGSGSRYSLVIWVASDGPACREGRSPWYEVDAAKGDADAQWNLGHLHKRGERGYQKDLAGAAAWYYKSASQDHPGAMNNLGLILEESDEAAVAVPKESRGPDMWFRRSAEAGEANGQLNFARRLEAAGDAAQAASWYAQAAVQGTPKAMVLLAEAWGSLPEPAKASFDSALRTPEAWLFKATQLGHGPAFDALARLYQAQGSNEPAVRWHLDGAEGGDAGCMMAMAKYYLEGRGVEQSVAKAKAWLRRAASAGEAQATELLAILDSAEVA